MIKLHHFFLVSGWMLLLPAACSPVKQERIQTPPVSIRTMNVTASSRVIPIRSSGILAGKTESKLSFKTGGIIDRIYVDEGQSVDKGQLLAVLDMAEIRSHVRQAELAAEKAGRDYQRAENLYEDSVATLEQLENARTALDLANSNLQIAKFNQKHSSIVAPAEGKILKRIAEEAEIIAPGYPVFLFASIQSDWVVRASVSDREVVRLRLLDSAIIHFDAYPNRVFRGLVSEIGTAADPYTGTFEIEIQPITKPDQLVSGLMARMEIYPSDAQDRVWIPSEAIVEGTGLNAVVYVLEEGKHRRRNVRIEQITDEGLMLREGLRPGEVLITYGMEYLRPDSRVEILNNEEE